MIGIALTIIYSSQGRIQGEKGEEDGVWGGNKVREGQSSHC